MTEFSLLILCAGFGKRMLDLTSETPKPLLKVKNKILLGNTINFFHNIGCNEIFINTHYLHNRVESYINKNFSDFPINLIYEPVILGTGGAVKNIFNYTRSKKICVVNSDIFWGKGNKLEIVKFLEDFNKIKHCKILLSKKENFLGLKRNTGDFNIHNGIVLPFNYSNEIIYYSGLQIVTKNIFAKSKKVFSMNKIWDHLILKKKLRGKLIKSKILHIGDKKSFEET